MQPRYVNDTALQSTLRELRDHARQPRVWGVLAILSLVVGLVGPFGTFAVMPLPVSILYWTIVVVGSYAIGFAASVFIAASISAPLPLPVRLVLCGLPPGILVAFYVAAINMIAFGAEALSLAPLLIYCPLIALAVTAGFTLFERTAKGDVKAAPAPPPVLKRVPLPQRGRLLALSVSDHYVEIVTERGTALVLMRLSDAIAETGDVPGLQVHRSHWVALDAVRRIVRKGGKLVLELETGSQVPVSRSYQEAAREAGLTA